VESESAHGMAHDCRRPIDGVSFEALYPAVAVTSCGLFERKWEGWWLMIDCIYKPKGSRIWRWKFRQQPKDGKIQDVSLSTSDKQVAEKRRTELLREKQHERDGMITPKPLRDAAQKNLEEHLEDFVGDMRRRGKSEKYLANLDYRNRALISACEWATVKDISADSFQTWRRGQDALADKTVNDYLEAARCFISWLLKNGRITLNPLQMADKVKVVEDETRRRRAFNHEEFQRLLTAVPADRQAVYLMAVHTGLRRSELAALKWTDVHLDAVIPFVQVRASTTKNSKPVTMRLHTDVVAALGALAGENGSGELVFKRFPRIERFRRDLKAAAINYQDESGLFADFHSLRKTFCTNLANLGVPSRVAMTLMRHSDRRLTDKVYTDENLLGTSSAIEAIPSYSRQASQGASQKIVAVGQNGSVGVTTSGGAKKAEAVANLGNSHGVTLSVTSGHHVENGGSGGARTRNLCRDRAAL
jgi:integrase